MFLSLSLMASLFPLTAFFSLLFQRKQFLIALLLLEGLALALVCTALFSSFSDLFIVLIILPMAACEASLGLSLLVSMARQFGSDILNNVTISNW